MMAPIREQDKNVEFLFILSRSISFNQKLHHGGFQRASRGATLGEEHVESGLFGFTRNAPRVAPLSKSMRVESMSGRFDLLYTLCILRCTLHMKSTQDVSSVK